MMALSADSVDEDGTKRRRSSDACNGVDGNSENILALMLVSSGSDADDMRTMEIKSKRGRGLREKV